jgi:hypothetical protein
MVAKSSAERTRAYRERKRKQGMKLIQIWVPDVDSPEFAAEAHRASLAVSRGPHAEEDQAWVDSVSAPWDE